MPNKAGEYSIPELADALDVATSTVWKWCDNAKKRKEMNARTFKRGRTRGWMIPGATVKAFLWKKARGLPYFED